MNFEDLVLQNASNIKKIIDDAKNIEEIKEAISGISEEDYLMIFKKGLNGYTTNKITADFLNKKIQKVKLDIDLLSIVKLPNITEGIIIYSEESKKNYYWNGLDRTNFDNWIKMTIKPSYLPVPSETAININLSNIEGIYYNDIVAVEIFATNTNSLVVGGKAFIYYKGTRHPIVNDAVWQPSKSSYQDTINFNQDKTYFLEFWYDGIQTNWSINEYIISDTIAPATPTITNIIYPDTTKPNSPTITNIII